MSNRKKEEIKTQLQKFGCPSPVILDKRITKDAYRLIRYLDILDSRQLENIKPVAVVEFQDRPLMYVVDSMSLSVDPDKKTDQLEMLRRALACRGEAPFLAVSKLGQLEIYQLHLIQSLGNCNIVKDTSDNASGLIPSLSLYGKFRSKTLIELSEEQPLSDYIFDLMEHTIKKITSLGISASDALSLSGRALFFRFLIDREIVDAVNDLSSICKDANSYVDCFANIKNTILTFKWLDKTFNGDLLPLSVEDESNYHSYFDKLDKPAQKSLLYHLKAIIEKLEPTGNSYQERLDANPEWGWGYLDFGHVPVGLLSQVYERHMHTHAKQEASETSIHYTPRNIAEYMVDEAFHGLSDEMRQRITILENNPFKILDPTAGGGVFLVICFRRLVAEHWVATGNRPDTKTIREILNKQLVGFDINQTSLNISALALYLTALELDGDPHPYEKLKFDYLCAPKGNVLFLSRTKNDPKKGFIAGSLNSSFAARHKDEFDIVIGNPPWKKFKKSDYEDEEFSKKLNGMFSANARQITKDRGLKEISKTYVNPDNVTDLPFVWQAMQWCKDSGLIVFALSGRVLFKNSHNGRLARDAIFSAAKVTGVLNAAELRFTKVWPDMDHPFCLFFAKNQIPELNSTFSYISPVLEDKINNQYRQIRIDASASQSVNISQIKKNPYLLKTLYKGNTFDATIIEKILSYKFKPLKEYWPKSKASTGYIVGKCNNSASKYERFPNLTPDTYTTLPNPYFIKPTELPLFDGSNLERPRESFGFNGPMLVIKKGIPYDRSRVRAILCKQNLIFNESYYGYSGYELNEGELKIRYLFLLLHSNLFLYWTILSSAKFGVERDVIQKFDIDNFPFFLPENLNDENKKLVYDLSEQLAHSQAKPWGMIDSFFFKLYSLTKIEQEVVSDTLSIALPFPQTIKRAQAAPSKTEIEKYVNRLKKLLAPFFEISNQSLDISICAKISLNQPWELLQLRFKSEETPINQMHLDKIMEIADEQSASRIIDASQSNCLNIAILRNYRYWTMTQARLCALEISDNWLDHFSLGTVEIAS